MLSCGSSGVRTAVAGGGETGKLRWRAGTKLEGSTSKTTKITQGSRASTRSGTGSETNIG